ncbi:MAG: hypothetical protein IKY46_03490 [Clostridia bacterium]|nr:hypothetical protein [Clostridia bacterium]
MNSIQVEFLKEFSELLKKYKIDQVYSDNDSIFFQSGPKELSFDSWNKKEEIYLNIRTSQADFSAKD